MLSRASEHCAEKVMEILGTLYGLCEKLEVKGIWKAAEKVANVQQLLSSQGVPQKVLWKEGNPEENFGHMIWHL